MLETEPVHRDEQGAWHVFRHADVAEVLADPATFSSDTSSLVPDQEDLRLFSRGNIVAMDPPRHREVRALVNQAFTPRVVAGLEPRIAEVTDHAARRGPGDRVLRPGGRPGLPAAGDRHRRAARRTGAGPARCSVAGRTRSSPCSPRTPR